MCGTNSSIESDQQHCIWDAACSVFSNISSYDCRDCQMTIYWLI